MKILVLMSSYRKNGNTDSVVSLLNEQLKSIAAGDRQPLEIETLYPGHMNIQTCRGCRTCFDKGEEHCPLKDDIPAIKAKIKESDGIIIACPVYVDDVNGILKNWIDRMAYVCHRPEFACKSAYLITTVGSSRSSHALRTMDTALRTWGFHIIGQVGLKTGALMSRSQINGLFQKKIHQAADRIYQQNLKRTFMNPSFISLMFFSIQQISWRREKKGTIDYEYWSGNGWLDAKTTFFIRHNANPLKVALARTVGRLLAVFMV
jgi:multimeric flavodoxin WrbA